MSRTRIKLTKRECEVMRLIAAGETNKMIAYHLGISEQTVKNHSYNAVHKLGAKNRAQAVAIYIPQTGGILNRLWRVFGNRHSSENG